MKDGVLSGQTEGLFGRPPEPLSWLPGPPDHVNLTLWTRKLRLEGGGSPEVAQHTLQSRCHDPSLPLICPASWSGWEVLAGGNSNRWYQVGPQPGPGHTHSAPVRSPSPTRLISQKKKLRLRAQSCRRNWYLNQACVALESVLFLPLGCWALLLVLRMTCASLDLRNLTDALQLGSLEVSTWV